MVRTFWIGFAIVAFALVVYAAWASLRMMSLIAISGELVAESERFEQGSETSRPRILVLGDSTAVGTGVKDPKGSVAGRLGTDFPTSRVVNLGVNGRRVAGLVADFPSYPADSFDLVVLQIGANDIVHGTPLPAFERDLRAAFEGANAIGKKVVALHSGNVGLAPLFPRPLGVIMRSRTLKIRDAYRRIAEEEGVTYVDLFHERKDDPFNGEARFYGADLFHPNEAGYDVWYRELRSAMGKAGIVL